MVIFRENTEDIYAGIEFQSGSQDAKDLVEFLNAKGVGKKVLKLTSLCCFCLVLSRFKIVVFELLIYWNFLLAVSDTCTNPDQWHTCCRTLTRHKVLY